MNSQHLDQQNPTNGPGRPKSNDLSLRILDAAIDVLGQSGYSDFSFVRVAEIARTTRAAIYRRWPTRESLAASALTKLMAETLLGPLDDPDVRNNIISVLESASTLLDNRRYRRALATAMTAAHHMHDENDLLTFLRARRGILIRQQLQKGVWVGQLPDDLDIEFVVDALNGPVFFRSLILDLPVPIEYARKLVDTILPRTK
ncbi:MAG: hypothetical protein COA47_16200 [Robiginitomaculum sp.]|nr:MAG: hypothetical protein COA47_16200 [Robiginitomaculum sp.]